jgi:hypothetical protein
MMGVLKGYCRRPPRRVGRIALLALLPSALAALWACDGASTLLVVLDPYQAAALDARGLSAARLEAGVEALGGARVEILQPGAQASNRLQELLSKGPPAGVYLSPLLASAAVPAAEEFPETLFFLDGTLPPGSGSRGNLRAVRYEMAEAHAEAGHALGELLSDPQPPPALRALAERAAAPGVAIVAVRPDKTVQRELELFRQALVETGAPVEVKERELTSLDDRARARRTLERLREEGAGVFLLRTSTLTGFCLEVLQAVGGVAVVEASPGVEAYADVLLLTLERDFPAALRKMGAAAAGGNAGEAAAVGSITAPVSLHWWGLPGNGPMEGEKEPAVDE